MNMPYFIKWTLSLLLAGLYWYVGLFFLGIVLVKLGIVDGSLIESDNIIIYAIAWIIAVPLAFKSTNTQFFFGAKKDN
tara:strand:- start:825 stop:1058 length:234 start_codon:yes stop_codon:yes gene_type:complete